MDLSSIINIIGTHSTISLYGTFMILLVTLFPYLCYTKGLSGLENGTASVIASIEPVMATMLGILIYKEKLTFINAAGMMLVLASIILMNRDGQ